MSGVEETYDFVIVGSGGGSGPAALLMKDAGKRPLILEREPVIGGTSGYSGGMMWLPCHGVGGRKDSPQQARTYMDSVIGEGVPGSTPARRDAFIQAAPEMIRFLEKKGVKFVSFYWPDYYQRAPGSYTYRTIGCPPFNLDRLGAWRDKMAFHPMITALPIAAYEVGPIQGMKQTWQGKLVLLTVMLRKIIRRGLLKQKVNGGGTALQGRIYEAVFREKIPVWTDTRVTDLIVENDRVVGVVAERDGKTIRVRANDGVLLNAGGFARNQEMREKYLPQPTDATLSWVSPGHTGDMIQAAERLGAATSMMDQSIWQLSSYDADGAPVGMHGAAAISKPHVIAVDSKGKRFVNEGSDYMTLGRSAYAAGAVPAWAIFDSEARNRYVWGMLPPGITPKRHIESGYITKADTVAELARKIGVDPIGLDATVKRFNGFCETGVDEDFHRGETLYDHHMGDVTVKPNPNLGTIAKAPYFAVKLQPGDVGTAGGLVCDENSRVLREDGSVIPGLYATGLTSAAVFGRNYLGAGSSVGPSAAFGWIAARHAARRNA